MAELQEPGTGVLLPLYPITSLQIGRKTSKGSILSVHIAKEAGQIIFFVNSPWCPKRSSGKDAGLWQLLSKAPKYDSPFANNSLMDRLLGEIMALEESYCRAPRLGSAGGNGGGASGRHRRVKWRSLDAFVRRLHARRRALSHLQPPPHGLCGCVTLEVSWSDVRGLRYENELQSDANLAMEVTRVVKREFDSLDHALQAHALRLNGSKPTLMATPKHGPERVGERQPSNRQLNERQLSRLSLPAASPHSSAAGRVGRTMLSGKRLGLGLPGEIEAAIDGQNRSGRLREQVFSPCSLASPCYESFQSNSPDRGPRGQACSPCSLASPCYEAFQSNSPDMRPRGQACSPCSLTSPCFETFQSNSPFQSRRPMEQVCSPCSLTSPLATSSRLHHSCGGGGGAAAAAAGAAAAAAAGAAAASAASSSYVSLSSAPSRGRERSQQEASPCDSTSQQQSVFKESSFETPEAGSQDQGLCSSWCSPQQGVCTSQSRPQKESGLKESPFETPKLGFQPAVCSHWCSPQQGACTSPSQPLSQQESGFKGSPFGTPELSFQPAVSSSWCSPQQGACTSQSSSNPDTWTSDSSERGSEGCCERGAADGCCEQGFGNAELELYASAKDEWSRERSSSLLLRHDMGTAAGSEKGLTRLYYPLQEGQSRAGIEPGWLAHGPESTQPWIEHAEPQVTAEGAEGAGRAEEAEGADRAERAAVEAGEEGVEGAEGAESTSVLGNEAEIGSPPSILVPRRLFTREGESRVPPARQVFFSSSSSVTGGADSDSRFGAHADVDANGARNTVHGDTDSNSYCSESGSASYCSTASSSAEQDEEGAEGELFRSPISFPNNHHPHNSATLLLSSPKPLLLRSTSAARLPPAARTYPDTLVLFRFTHPDLPAALADVITTDQRLLRQLESGLPAWAVLLQSCAGLSALYRPWMRPLVAYACFIVSLVTVLIGFYDLYKNIPVLREMLARLLGPLWSIVGTWDMGTRLRYLGTILFLQNWERAFKWMSAVWKVVSHVLSNVSHILSLLLSPFRHHWLLLSQALLVSFTRLLSGLWGLVLALGKLVTSSGRLLGYAARPLWLLGRHTVVPLWQCVYGGFNAVYSGFLVVYQIFSSACTASLMRLSSAVLKLIGSVMQLIQLLAQACSGSVLRLAGSLLQLVQLVGQACSGSVLKLTGSVMQLLQLISQACSGSLLQLSTAVLKMSGSVWQLVQLVGQACSGSVLKLSGAFLRLGGSVWQLVQLVTRACSGSVSRLAASVWHLLSLLWSQAAVVGKLLGVIIQPVLFVARSLWAISLAVILPLLQFVQLILTPLITAVLALLKLPIRLSLWLLQLASFLHSSFLATFPHFLSHSFTSSVTTLSHFLTHCFTILAHPLTSSFRALSHSLTLLIKPMGDSFAYASKAVSTSLRLVGGARKLGSATKAVGQQISSAGSAMGQVSAAAGSAVVRTPSSSLLKMWNDIFQKLFRAFMWIFKGVGSFIAAANRHRLSTRHYVVSQVRQLQARLVKSLQSAQATVQSAVHATAQELIRKLRCPSKLKRSRSLVLSQVSPVLEQGCGEEQQKVEGGGLGGVQDEFWDAVEVASGEEFEEESEEECAEDFEGGIVGSVKEDFEGGFAGSDREDFERGFDGGSDEGDFEEGFEEEPGTYEQPEEDFEEGSEGRCEEVADKYKDPEELVGGPEDEWGNDFWEGSEGELEEGWEDVEEEPEDFGRGTQKFEEEIEEVGEGWDGLEPEELKDRLSFDHQHFEDAGVFEDARQDAFFQGFI